MTRMAGEAVSHAPPEKVWAALTDASRMSDWFAGARDVETAGGWPAVGATIAWRVGPSRFSARVVESDAPRVLRLEAETPSARSRVTNRIEARPEGARVERVVEAEWHGAMGRMLGPLVIGPSVKREARKLAAAAEKR